MKRAFDILPPFIPEKIISSPKRKKGNCLPTMLMTGVFIVASFLIVSALQNPKSFETKVPSPTKSNSTNSNFELFNAEGQSNLTSQPTNTLRLLNASGKDEALNQAETLLTKANFTIEQKRKADNLYDQTVVYYKKTDAKLAQSVADSLAPAFQAKIEESDNLSPTYNILVILGQK